MAIHIDLSELHPGAVEDMIKAHVSKPLQQDLLFKVSKESFRYCLKRRPKNSIKVSADELNKLNQFLGKARSTKDYAVWKNIKCSQCGKQLTFYDIFETGRKKHGDDYVKRLLAGEEYHVHIQKRGSKMEVACTGCSTLNLVLAGYDGPEY